MPTVQVTPMQTPGVALQHMQENELRSTQAEFSPAQTEFIQDTFSVQQEEMQGSPLLPPQQAPSLVEKFEAGN